MPISRTLGSTTVIALDDGSGVFFKPRAEAFPNATPQDWARADALDPGARTADDQWLLRFRCFAIRLDSGTTVLVDTGIGPVQAPAAAWAPVPGRLPEELAAAGITPADVTAVVLTHLHTDHIGWAVVVDGENRRPYFPNARYVLQRAEADAFATAPARAWALDPLRASGQLDLVDGDTKLGPGLSTVATPGHTPGHQCVLLTSSGETLAVAGDLLVHALQLAVPAIAYALEADPALAAQQRIRMFDRLAEVDGVLATAHLSQPWVGLVRPGAPERS